MLKLLEPGSAQKKKLFYSFNFTKKLHNIPVSMTCEQHNGNKIFAWFFLLLFISSTNFLQEEKTKDKETGQNK